MNGEIICDVCGKDVSDPVRTNQRCCIEIGIRMLERNKDNDWVQDQFGDYRPGIYRICVACVLRGHGVKPNKEQEDGNSKSVDCDSG